MTSANSRQNIYQMYAANGNRCGFWVRRNSWSNNVAQVTSIAGQTEGPLTGKAPYYNNPKVFGNVYRATTGSCSWNMGGSGKGQELTSAGTYGYELIDTPTWWKEAQE